MIVNGQKKIIRQESKMMTGNESGKTKYGNRKRQRKKWKGKKEKTGKSVEVGKIRPEQKR